MDKNYFKKYYDFENSHWWFKVRSKIIQTKISEVYKTNSKLKILNIGVASGQTSIMLSKFGEVISVENDLNTCKFLKDELNIDVVHASIDQLPFDEASFDLVCAFDVIEHVKNDNKAIDEMYRVSKPGGILFITVPAYMHLWSQHDVINHHFRRYTLKKVVKLFNIHAGNFIYKSYFNTFLYVPILLVRIISNRLSSLIKVDIKSDFETFGAPMINKFAQFIFTLERFTLRIVKMPFGVSIMVLFLKPYSS